jgi:predicted alpha/beta hydrolase family esterase
MDDKTPKASQLPGGMTRQVLFVQGGGEGTHDDWDDKLVASLKRELGPGYLVLYPRMPNEAEPSYAAWKPALVEEIAGLDDGAIVVGHSIGGTVLINVLTELPTAHKLSAVLLIAAPFVGEGGWPSDDVAPMDNAGARLPPATPIYLFQGSDDDTTPAVHIDLYARAIPQAHVRRLESRDHQLNNDMTEVAEEIRALA